MYKNLLLFIALFTSINFISQSANISGTIIDDATGLGIPFATIQVKGTDKGTTSDIDGKFSIEAESNQTIIVKMVGYVAKSSYTFDESKSVIDGKFCGLAIDVDNESELTDQCKFRIGNNR